VNIVVFGDARRVGAVSDGIVVDLNYAYRAWLRDHRGSAAAAAGDHELPSGLEDLINAGRAGLDRAASAAEYARAQLMDDPVAARPVSDVALHAPSVRRPRIACAAGNFAAHTRGSQISRLSAKQAAPSDALAGLSAASTVPPESEIVARTRARGVPRGFWKDFSFPVGPDEAIAYPAGAALLDYEGEVAVVLGRRARDVSADAGRSYLWGVTLLNDLSLRGVSDSGSLTFVPGKNFDGSASVGPSILVGEFDPADIEIEVRVNGQLRQRYSTRDMIFSHVDYLEYLTRTMTLWPGDLISGGSGAGSAIDSSTMKPGGERWPDDLNPDRFLNVGDVVELSSERIGVLRNRIVAGPPARGAH
jgi:2-keto-4-pentenoate hydratase/2-oxohepta-3-ene-1,7-dioic acid hydratase in catechol pathway